MARTPYSDPEAEKQFTQSDTSGRTLNGVQDAEGMRQYQDYQQSNTPKIQDDMYYRRKPSGY